MSPLRLENINTTLVDLSDHEIIAIVPTAERFLMDFFQPFYCSKPKGAFSLSEGCGHTGYDLKLCDFKGLLQPLLQYSSLRFHMTSVLLQ